MTRWSALRTGAWLAALLVMGGAASADPWVPADDSLVVLRVTRSPAQQALTALERDIE